MTKTIKADGKEIELKTNGLVPITYQKEFKRDFFEDVRAIVNNNYNAEVISYMLWVFAFTADSTIPSAEKWLSGFEVFPLLDFIPVVTEILTIALTTNKANEEESEKTSKKKVTS